MLAVCLGIYLLAAVLFAAVTMLLSVITQNALAVTCGLMGYLIVDLFAVFPERFPTTADDLESQAERDPDEYGICELPADPSGRQILPELSGGAGNLLRYCYSCIVDRKAEIS